MYYAKRSPHRGYPGSPQYDTIGRRFFAALSMCARQAILIWNSAGDVLQYEVAIEVSTSQSPPAAEPFDTG